VKNIRLDSQKQSIISDHVLEHDHSIDWENVKILDFDSYYCKKLKWWSLKWCVSLNKKMDLI